MIKTRLEITENVPVARDCFRLRLAAGSDLKAGSGQFVDIALENRFLRRPISICDSGPDGITLLYKVVGDGTRQMSMMKAGESLEILAPLGHGFNPQACRSGALLVGGGLGAAPMYLLAKELLGLGKKVSVVLGFNRADDILLEREFAALGVDTTVATLDGSVGVKGFVTDAIAATKPVFDRFYCCGPLPMMKALCQALPATGGEASLEERMGCGAGFCYGCSCKTLTGTKRICKDGPVFDKEEILW